MRGSKGVNDTDPNISEKIEQKARHFERMVKDGKFNALAVEESAILMEHNQP